MTGRLLAGVATAGAAGALLSGCGAGQTASASGGGDSTQTASATTRSADPPKSATARRGPSRAQALAFVRAVNLSVGDLPEASVYKWRAPASTAAERREENTCEKGSERARLLAAAASPKLRRGQELEIEDIGSEAGVLSSESPIAHDFALARSRSLRECLARVLTHNLDDRPIREARWGHVTVSRLAVDAPGAGDTAGVRVVAILSIPFSEISVPVYVDFLTFSVGPGVVTLTAASATQPVPATTEQELVSLLLERAKAQPL
jgi:uncharacterized protein YceK